MKVKMTKEEAIAFAKKYLADRKNDYVSWDPIQTIHLSDDDVIFLGEKIRRVWDIAVEYVLEDIIPFLYGEALD